MTKPNIVFIFTDDQTYSSIHALGNKEIILELKEEIGFDIDVPIFDPKTKEEDKILVCRKDKIFSLRSINKR